MLTRGGGTGQDSLCNKKYRAAYEYVNLYYSNRFYLKSGPFLVYKEDILQ